MEKTRSRGEHVRLQRVVEHQNVHGRTQGYTESRARGVDGKDQDPFTMLSSGKAVATSSCPAVSDPAMQEPSDMTMATDLRAYREWPGEFTVRHPLIDVADVLVPQTLQES